MKDMPGLRIVGNVFSKRVKIASVIMMAAMALLCINLWRLQVLRGESYDERSRKNMVRLIRLPAPRGSILDCNGQVLAENRPGFQFSVVAQELDNPGELIQRCAVATGIPQEKMRALVEKSKSLPRFTTYPLKKNLSFEQASLLQSLTADLRGAVVEVKPYRSYPLGDTLCHVIGAVGEVNPDELIKSAKAGYHIGDYIGKSGLEKEYEHYLKGEDGWERLEIDAKGRQLAEVVRNPPRRGADILLTVDSSFQKYVEGIFLHRAGSVVALDPESGRILAIVSKPGFDLNVFSPSISEKDWKNLNNDPLHPLENRAIRGLYSPGSAFKIVTAAAALSERIVSPERKFLCTGELDVGGIVFRCWNRYGHGNMNLHNALVESCDVYFYEVGRRLGADRMAKWAALFGLGKPSGISLPQELPGLVPTNSWKMRTYGEPIKDGETVSIAIGQGFLVSTPLQLAVMVSAFANGGKIMRPAIVNKIRSSDGEVIYEHSPVERWLLPLSDEHREMIRAAMMHAVQDRRGTGRKAFIPGLNVKGKTGTTQVISTRDQTLAPDQIPYHERTHAIFVAFVDDRPKKIALVVVVEHGGGGGATAAPIARKILCRYYGLKDPGDPKD
ncbi:MAG: penicillin-binding protein 2 [Desulfomonilaceae bacterium]